MFKVTDLATLNMLNILRLQLKCNAFNGNIPSLWWKQFKPHDTTITRIYR